MSHRRRLAKLATFRIKSILKDTEQLQDLSPDYEISNNVDRLRRTLREALACSKEVEKIMDARGEKDDDH